MATIERISKQISITLSPVIMEKLEKESKKLGMNRSAFIGMCIMQYFNVSEAQSLLQQMNTMMERAEAMRDEAQMNLFQLQEEKS